MRRATIVATLVLLAVAATAAAQGKTGLAVTLPARVKGDLELLGETHQVEFAIPAPGLLSISLKGKSGVTPNLEIFDPSDTLVDASGHTTTSSTKVKVKDLPVTAEGTWRLRVSDAGVETGSYKLKISFERTEEFDGQDTVTPPGTLAELTFRGESGDVAKIKLKRRSGDLTPRVLEIVAPDASNVNLSAARTSNSSKKQKIKKIALTQSGDYTVRVTGADGTSGTVSIDVSLGFDVPAKLKVDYSGDDFSAFDSTTVIAHVDPDDLSDYRLVLYDAATRQRLDLPTATQTFDSTGSRRVRIPAGVTLRGLLLDRKYSPPQDGASLAVDGVNVFDEAVQNDISGAAGLLRFSEAAQTVSPDPAAAAFLTNAAHHTVQDIYDLILFCFDQNVSTVFYPGDWPSEGNGTLPGKNGGTEAGNLSPHVRASGALGVFASSLDAHGISLVLVYDDASWLASPATATARADEIAGYNASATASRDVDGALVALDVTPTPSTGADLCDLLASFATNLTGVPTYAGTFPAFETVDLTWDSETRPLTEQCLRAADGIVHHARRTLLDGPDSLLEIMEPLLQFGADSGLTDAIWTVLDTTDRAPAGGSPDETFFGRVRTEFLDAMAWVQGLGGVPSTAGPAILDREGFEGLSD